MKVHTFAQYSDSWWTAHRGRPSASNFGKIITPARGDYSKSAVEYAYELIAELYDPDYGPKDEYASAAMRNGTILEPQARRQYEFERDTDVHQVGMCETDDGRFISSPDGLCGDDGCLELKSPTYKMHIKYLLSGKLPSEYAPQCHGHLFVTGRKWCDFMSFCFGLPPLIVRVEPDDYTERLAESLDQFWTAYSSMRRKIAAGREVVVKESVKSAGGVLEDSYF